ncbi:MAG: asparagine synthase (glutamine-hydrolyzing) [Acidobacteriia bacterium]|nr:asparagine synthase (glutamine-hydrolyzing) [Terriglobia bacterium]
MCGIAGFIDLRRQTSTEDLRAIAKRMADTVRHRGPDSEGVWVDAAAGIALGHRRLAIIDLSPMGHQPMVSGSGRFVIIYNGELYNFQELRQELEHSGDYPTTFRGQSDTEVILTCFDRWGVEASLSRFNGMFAFAVWDRHEHILHLSRDRMGEKPLYYGWLGETFLFGSELKALCAHPDFRGEINRDALMLYMRHNCVPAPHSIYRGIYKLPPGHLLSLPRGHSPNMTPVPYWSLEEAVARGSEEPFHGTAEEAVKQLDTLLRDAIRMRMLADVPLGGLLSGGVDSSTVTALMQAQSTRPVKTFTIGLHESAYDEAQNAAAVAHHLGTEHTELYITPAEVLSVIPRLPTMYDEPFADSSQIPSFLVSQMARQHVTVGLSGDGGDELFGGYNRHVWSSRIWNAVGWLPLSARSSLAGAIRCVTPQTWDTVLDICAPFLPHKAKHRNPGLKLYKIAEMLPVKNRGALYLRHTSHWADPADVVVGGTDADYLGGVQSPQVHFLDFTQQMMFLDTVTYLPDDILAKVDRASMAVSLEMRVPLLDHRVVEFAWSLPPVMKIRQGRGKWLLRQLLYSYVPRELVDRPKAGLEALLDEHRLKSQGFFNPGPIRKIWAAHLSGQGSWQYHLWDALMFQAWLETRREPSGDKITPVPPMSNLVSHAV